MENTLITLLNKSNIGFAIHEILYDEKNHPVDYRFLNINEAGLKIMNTDESTIGKTAMEWSQNPESLDPWLQRYSDVVQKDIVDHFEMFDEHLKKWFSVTACKTGENNFACSYYDITPFVKIKNKLEYTSNQFETILENTNDLILFLDHDMKIQYFNLHFCEFFEIDCANLNKNVTVSILEKMIRFDFLHYIQSVLENENHTKVINHPHTEGLVLYEYVEWKASEVFDDQKESIGFLLVGHDVSKREKEKIQLHKTLYLDSLTGLANKKYLLENFDQFKQNSLDCFAGVFIDLDNFKMVNDLFGHTAGNEFLKMISEKLQKVTKDNGIVVRLSGDEFFILLHEIHDKEKAIRFMDDLFKEFEEPFDYEECAAPVFVNFSAGISCYGEDAKTIQELISHADIAMYFAKQNGKNSYQFYDVDQEKEVFESFFLLQDLINALRNEEFIAYYQPVIETNSMQVIEFEGLGRWNHPLYGVLPARDFIGLMKLSGRLGQFTEQVMRRIAGDMKSWQEKGLKGIKVSLNLAIEQLENINFPMTIKEIFKDVDFSMLRVQITEDDVIEANDVVLKNLATLKKMGLLITLNDFDLNHLAVSKLQHFDFDVIKLDKSFSHNINDNEYSKIVIDMMQRLVKAFGKDCIVQGVETKEHFETMRELDFNIMQGYYFSDAISPDDLESRVRKNKDYIIWK